MAPLGPFTTPPRLAAGCSGGPDSLALTLLAAEWAAARGGSVLALVADHGLRSASAAEAAGVVAQLAGHGIAARLLPLGLEPGPRLQERAREARRQALLLACREAGILHLLLGHQADDQSETLIFRALRGSGARGLAAMAALRPAGAAMLLRPLLGIGRDRLEATLLRFGATPLRDPSNLDPRFARARLRGLGLSALDAAPFQARRARMAAAEASRFGEAVRLLPEGCARLDLAALGRDGVAARLLAALVQAVGGGRHPPSSAAAARLLAAGQGSLGGCVLRGDGWLIREEAGPAIPAEAGALWDGRFRLRAAVPGCVVAALGADAAAFRGRWRHLPAAALATLPCLRIGHENGGDGRLAAVPHLSYRASSAGELNPLSFAPRSGPVTESFQPSPDAFNAWRKSYVHQYPVE